MSEATQTQTLEQTLNKTDFGHLIYENRKVFFAALISVLVVVTGYVLWKQNKDSNARDTAVKVFEFQNTVWADVKAGKKTPQDLLISFDALDKDIQSAPVMIPLALEISNFLYDKSAYAEAETVLSKLNDSAPIAGFFVSLQKAAVLEKVNKIDEAIAVLEKLAQNKDTLMGSKVFLELGRLYLVKGEKGKAQTQLDYVVTTFPNDEHAKIAKLYLSKLAE